MKTVFKILYIVVALFMLSYTYYHVKADNICETIYGCFGLWTWIYYWDRE